MVDGPTVRKNGGGEDSSRKLVLSFLKVSCTASVFCQTLFNDRILGTHWFVRVFLIESEGSKTINLDIY